MKNYKMNVTLNETQTKTAWAQESSNSNEHEYENSDRDVKNGMIDGWAEVRKKGLTENGIEGRGEIARGTSVIDFLIYEYVVNAHENGGRLTNLIE